MQEHEELQSQHREALVSQQVQTLNLLTVGYM